MKLILSRKGFDSSQCRFHNAMAFAGSFFPDSAETALSFHSNLARWSREGEDCYLRSASRGQEFVLDTLRYPGVISWLRDIL